MLMVDLFEYTSGSIPKYYSIEDGYLYVTSKKSKVFHKMTCEQVATIKEDNLIYFHSLEESQKSGRRGCKQCTPEK
jgi:methylphosphotriester-DNA--protein-cysteine methyltransferase